MKGITTLVGVVVATLLLPLQGAAEEEIYRWVDEKGVVHFGAAPPEDHYSQKVNEAELDPIQTIPDEEEAGPEVVLAPAQRPQDQAPVSARNPSDPPERIDGLTEAQWRTEAAKLKAYLSRIEHQIELANGESDFGGYAFNETVLLSEVRDSARELEQLKKARDEAQVNLRNFERRARKAGVPPGWLR